MILVLNLGLKSMRAIVFDDRGRRLLTAARPVHTFLEGDRIEQDPAEWRRLTLEVLAEATATPAIRDALKAITITTSACNLVCTAPDGSALGRAMLVSDTRAATEATDLATNPLFLSHAATSGNLRAEPSMTLPRLLWLRNHDPARWNHSRFFLSSNAWLIAQLTGITITDPLNAEKSGFQTSSNSYPAELLDNLGIPAEKLAPVAPILSTVGPLLPDIAAAAGLANRNIPVILTTYDAICGVFGTAAGQQGIACDVSGTVTSLRTISTSPPTGPLQGLFSQHIPSTGLHIVGGSNNLGGGLIEWVRQCFYESNPDAYDAIESDAATAGPGADGLVFLPYLLGERAPLWDPTARGVFFGIERRHGRPEMVRAVMESAACAMAWLRDALESLTGPIRSIRATGGLARLRLISQLKADILGVPVEITDEFESTALGASFLCQLATGSLSSLDDASHCISIRETLEPNQSLGPFYQELLAFHRDLYSACRPLFSRRASRLPLLHASQPVTVGNL